MSNNEKQASRENKDFIQMYRDFLDDIGNLGYENPNALRLFFFITKHMDNGNALCISMNALSEILKQSRQTISKSVKYLKDDGWICVLKSGTSNIYIVNPEIAWTSYDRQKQYCKFQSNVIVTPSENAEYLNNMQASFRYKHIDDDFIAAVQKNKISYDANIEENQDA